jgi:hypothetical protein
MGEKRYDVGQDSNGTHEECEEYGLVGYDRCISVRDWGATGYLLEIFGAHLTGDILRFRECQSDKGNVSDRDRQSAEAVNDGVAIIVLV